MVPYAVSGERVPCTARVSETSGPDTERRGLYSGRERGLDSAVTWETEHPAFVSRETRPLD